MVKIYCAFALPINNVGRETPITRAECWNALRIKARRPQDFIEMIDDCEIVSEDDGGMSRVLTPKARPGMPNMKMEEKIEFHDQHQMIFDTPAMKLHVTNILADKDMNADGELVLTYTSEMELPPQILPGSAEEGEKRKMQAQILHGSLVLTVKNINDMKDAGQI